MGLTFLYAKSGWEAASDCAEDEREQEVMRLLRIQIQVQRTLQELLMTHQAAGEL